MFEYTEEGANSVVAGIESNISAMEQEAAEMSAEAEADIAEAEACESEAQECLAKAESAASSCPHYKTEWKTRTVTDTVANEDGTYREESREEQYSVQVIDSGADAAAMAEAEAATARAAECQVKATGLRASAAALRVLSSALSGAASALRSTLSAVKGAIELAEVAIGKVEAEIKETISNISKVLSIFDVPDANNFKEWITGVKSNIFGTKTINSEVKEQPTSFEEAKQLAKEYYAEYLKTLDLTDEERQQLQEKFDEAIDRAVIVSNEEMDRMAGNKTTVGLYRGEDYPICIREGWELSVPTLIHEVGGHGSGYLDITVGYYYYADDDVNKENPILYVGNVEEATVELTYGSLNPGIHAIDEATTEYFTQKIYGEESEGNIYNYSVEMLSNMTTSLTNHNICDGDQVLFDSYEGDDKYLFASYVNEICGTEESYQELGDFMDELNNPYKYNGATAEFLVGIYSAQFEERCAEYEQAHLNG